MMLNFLFPALRALGYLDKSRARMDEMLAEARRLTQPFTLACALGISCLIVPIGDWDVGSVSEILRRSEELSTLAAEQGFPAFRSGATLARAWCMVALGQEQEGVELFTQGLTTRRADGTKAYMPYHLTVLADAYRKARQPEAALQQLAEADAVMSATEERWMEAETYRLRGELLQDLGDRIGAEASFRTAIKVAKGQSAKFWELRATLSIARLLRDQGNRAESLALLAPVYGWFTEGFDTPVLKEAKALLEALA
jgi:predicted ATPase